MGTVTNDLRFGLKHIAAALEEGRRRSCNTLTSPSVELPWSAPRKTPGVPSFSAFPLRRPGVWAADLCYHRLTDSGVSRHIHVCPRAPKGWAWP